MAKLVPGKEEFYETLRYFKNLLTSSGMCIGVVSVYMQYNCVNYCDTERVSLSPVGLTSSGMNRCICVYVYICICVYVYMCICVYVLCVYVYMCIGV
jgi:hypothetical protein